MEKLRVHSLAEALRIGFAAEKAPTIEAGPIQAK